MTDPLGPEQPKPCTTRDPELFFSTDPRDVAEAKRICRTECAPAVREACLELALSNEGRWNTAYRTGVFGGLTARERFRIALRRYPPRARPAREPAAGAA